MAATSRVFNTPELLETILLHLPMNDIISANTVSKQWRASITGSVSLQRALFLVAVPGQYLTLDLHAATEATNIYWDDISDDLPLLENNTFSINPVFKATTYGPEPEPLSYTVDTDESCKRRAYVFELDIEPNDSSKSLTTAGAMPSMYLTQPPCTMVTLWYRDFQVDQDFTTAGDHFVTAVLREERGVTLGLIKEIQDRMMLGCRPDSPHRTGRPQSFYIGFQMDIEDEEAHVD